MLKDQAARFATQANALLTIMTGLIVGIVTELIPTQNQIVILVVFSAIWAEAYIFRLAEKRLDKGELAKTNAEIEIMKKRLDVEIAERRAVTAPPSPKPT